MRATFAGFNTALSALQANQKRLDITGQNLANMNTVGYTRQHLNTSGLNYSNGYSPVMNGSSNIVGFGVGMNGVSQIRDPYLDVQYRLQMAKATTPVLFRLHWTPFQTSWMKPISLVCIRPLLISSPR